VALTIKEVEQVVSMARLEMANEEAETVRGQLDTILR